MVALAVWLVATAIVLGTGILSVLAVGGLLVQFMLGVAELLDSFRLPRAPRRRRRVLTPRALRLPWAARRTRSRM
jgi:hypothetical protein